MNSLGPNKSKMARSRLPLDLEPQYNTSEIYMTYPQAPWQFQGLPSKTKQWGRDPIPGTLPKIVGIILPLISLWNYFTFQGHFCLLRWPREYVSLYIHPLITSKKKKVALSRFFFSFFLGICGFIEFNKFGICMCFLEVLSCLCFGKPLNPASAWQGT